MSQQMIVVGDAPPTGHWGGTLWAGNPEVTAGATPDITRDKQGMDTAKNLGRRVAELACGCKRRGDVFRKAASKPCSASGWGLLIKPRPAPTKVGRSRSFEVPCGSIFTVARDRRSRLYESMMSTRRIA